jgi:hypothetical protein
VLGGVLAGVLLRRAVGGGRVDRAIIEDRTVPVR